VTFAELLEEVVENIGVTGAAGAVQRGEMKRLLNLAMREISLRVGVPLMNVVVPGTGVVSAPFTLPVRFHAEGLKRAVVVIGETTTGRELREFEVPIYSPGTAVTFHPKWRDEDYCGPPFLVYTPADATAGFMPVGIAEAQYRFLVQAVPPDMVEPSDEPFAVLDVCEEPPVRLPGAMPGYHRVLAHHVSYELLQRIGDERWQAFYARYREMELELFSQATPMTQYIPGRLVGGEHAQSQGPGITRRIP